ncbi:TetR family transcriptional regulator [Streptomyces sp. NPDC058231]|uniref:TetR family transcriptional regulator n=1 Tax=Streptomyces sp. NPDC058231 TaxID=3346392 RepID=UPI0036E2CFC6
MRKPVQARSKAKRKDVLDAAALVFAEKGYAGATVQDILELSGVSKGALYHFFRTKSEIAEAVVTEGFTMEAAQPQSPRLQSVVDASIALAVLTPRVPAVKAAARLATEPDHPRFFGTLWRAYIPQVQELLAQAEELGELRTGVDPAPTAQTWVAAYVGVDLMCRLSYDELPARIAAMNAGVAHGIATPQTFGQLDLSVDRGLRLVQRSRTAAARPGTVQGAAGPVSVTAGTARAASDPIGLADDEVARLGTVLRSWENGPGT